MRTNPEWRSWVTLLAVTLRAVDDPAWTACVSEPGAARPPDAPLLSRAILPVAPALARRWLSRLFAAASESGGLAAAAFAQAAGASPLHPVALVEAAVCQDGARLDGFARTLALAPRPLRVVADLAAMPLLQACGRTWQGLVSSDWTQGYCPICGAWPALAEARGLEKTRRLRCGRCGSDWGTEWLRCLYCRTADHSRLGSLVSETSGESRAVDICKVCRGYIKTMTTRKASPGPQVALGDLATVDMDMAALGHGYARPDGPGYPLDVRLVKTPSRLRAVLPWRS